MVRGASVPLRWLQPPGGKGTYNSVIEGLNCYNDWDSTAIHKLIESGLLNIIEPKFENMFKTVNTTEFPTPNQ